MSCRFCNYFCCISRNNTNTAFDGCNYYVAGNIKYTMVWPVLRWTFFIIQIAHDVDAIKKRCVCSDGQGMTAKYTLPCVPENLKKQIDGKSALMWRMCSIERWWSRGCLGELGEWESVGAWPLLITLVQSP